MKITVDKAYTNRVITVARDIAATLVGVAMVIALIIMSAGID